PVSAADDVTASPAADLDELAAAIDDEPASMPVSGAAPTSPEAADTDAEAEVEEELPAPAVDATPISDEPKPNIAVFDAAAAASPIAPFPAEAVAVPPAAPVAPEASSSPVPPSQSVSVNQDVRAAGDAAASATAAVGDADLTDSARAKLASVVVDAPSADDDLMAAAAMEMLAQGLADDV
ncbi:MAG: hypothetical protein ACI970_000720, partial [Myxococcota bacterium]